MYLNGRSDDVEHFLFIKEFRLWWTFVTFVDHPIIGIFTLCLFAFSMARS